LFNCSGTPNGNAHPAAAAIDNWRFQAGSGWGNGLLNPPPASTSWDNAYDKPIDLVTNADCPQNYDPPNDQNIRYRHGKYADTGNFLFCDGHVGQFHVKKVKINPNNTTGWVTTDLLRKYVAVNWP
jgi:prepilin-type processing-associated H-X9-DG protein